MVDRLILPATIAATFGSGIVAGVFYAFSSFVMSGLARAAPQCGFAAMQGINITVITPSFMIPFLGTALISSALAGYGLLRWDAAGATLILSASMLYLIGSFGVTMIFNVPLNDALAAMDPTSDKVTEFWQSYLSDWGFWNHIRTAASLGSTVLFGLYLIRHTR